MKIIATGWKSGLSLLENTIRNREVKNALANFGIKCQEVIGCYQGEQELGFIFDCKFEHKERLQELFFDQMNQESILCIQLEGTAIFKTAEGGWVPCGKFTKVSKDGALNCEGWSYIDGEYWVIL
jgi:hypothetical protein